MRLLASTLQLALLSLPHLVATSSLPDDCLSIRSTALKKADPLMQQFATIVCDKGCKPTMAQFDSWGKTSLIDPLFSTVLQKMGLPSGPTITQTLSNQITTTVKKDCAGIVGKESLCKDKRTLGAFAQCIKNQVVPAFIAEMEEYSLFITEDMCEKAEDYVQGPDLWEDVIPGAFREYAETC